MEIDKRIQYQALLNIRSQEKDPEKLKKIDSDIAWLKIELNIDGKGDEFRAEWNKIEQKWDEYRKLQYQD